MEKTFLESREFSEWVKSYLSDDDLAELQNLLRADPDAGSVMPGCGGLRKMRIADPRRGKGKRGGARVIYLHVPETDVVFLMDVYGKDEQQDLTPDQKKILRSIAEDFKRTSKRPASGR